jgi:probable F420-dependent oxidoreductase
MAPRFRFGVVGESVTDAAGLTRTVQRAEQLGYDTFLLRDHFVAEPFGHQLAPLIALTAAAAVSSTLRLGTLVLANDYRHPVLLAKEAATLDVLSGGRLELGLGAGWLKDEYDRAGLVFDPPGARVDRLAESLRVLKDLLSGKPVTTVGEHYQITDLDTFPVPVQRPYPPLLIGAGSRRMLELAGREADIVGVLPRALPSGTISGELSERTPEATAQKVEWIRDGAGDRFDDIEISVMISPVITHQPVEAAAIRFAVARGWGAAAAEQVMSMPSAFIGTADRIAEQMVERRDRYGISYYVVPDEAMDEFAPIVSALGRTS